LVVVGCAVGIVGTPPGGPPYAGTAVPGSYAVVDVVGCTVVVVDVVGCALTSLDAVSDGVARSGGPPYIGATCGPPHAPIALVAPRVAATANIAVRGTRPVVDSPRERSTATRAASQNGQRATSTRTWRRQ
jgi:hypothetical protein